MEIKKVTIIIIVALLITFSGCSESSSNKPDFDVASNNVTIWEDSTGEDYIILAFEVSNLANDPLYFKESDFDIVDENGTLIETMKSVCAYPSVVGSDDTAVFYDAKASDKIPDTSIKLIATPHIEAEKTNAKRKELFITGTTVGGSLYATGIVKNSSSKTEYNDVHIAIVSRNQSNEVVSAMTTTIESIKPGEKIEFRAEDCLKKRDLGPDIVTKYQNFVYLDP